MLLRLLSPTGPLGRGAPCRWLGGAVPAGGTGGRNTARVPLLRPRAGRSRSRPQGRGLSAFQGDTLGSALHTRCKDRL